MHKKQTFLSIASKPCTTLVHRFNPMHNFWAFLCTHVALCTELVHTLNGKGDKSFNRAMLKLASARMLTIKLIYRALRGSGAKYPNPAILSITGEKPTVKEFLTVQTVGATLAHTE